MIDDRIRPYQQRRGREGDVEVRQVTIDTILAREADGTMAIYEPNDFAARYPEIICRSALGRRELRVESVPTHPRPAARRRPKVRPGRPHQPRHARQSTNQPPRRLRQGKQRQPRRDLRKARRLKLGVVLWIA